MVGGRSEMEQLEERQKMQRDNALHQQLASQGRNKEGLTPALVDEMLESDLDPGVVQTLDNLIADDLPLANFDSAEVHELRWLARAMLMAVEAAHPPESSNLTGERRKFLLDDSRQALKPLDDLDRSKLQTFLLGAIARATRGEDGFQQEQFNTSIQATRVEDQGQQEDESGWISWS